MGEATGESSAEAAATPVRLNGLAELGGGVVGKVLDQSYRRFRANILARVGLFGVSVAFGLWLPPYLIKQLGLEVYGLVPLATQITAYMGVVTVALTIALGRFLTIELERNDPAANRTFNTALVANSYVGGFLLLPCLGAVLVAPSFLNVPPGSEGATRWLLAGTCLAFLLGFIANPFVVSTLARNRFDISSSIDGLAVVIRLACIVGLFAWLRPQLWQIGLAFVVAAFLSGGGYVWSWRRLTPELSIDWRSFDYQRLKALVAMSTWNSLNVMGAMLSLNIDLLVVNMMVGAKAGGIYGVVMQWVVLLRSMAMLVATLLQPTITACFAQDDERRMMRLSSQAVKLMGLALALPVGLICGLARPLLGVWLGADFAKYAPLLQLMTIHLSVNLGVLPLSNIQTAVNRVRWPGLATLLMGLGNLGLALLLAGPLHWGMYGVAAAGAIMLTARNALFTPLYTAHIFRRPWHSFARQMTPSVIGAVSLALVLVWSAEWVGRASWLGVVGLGAAGTVLFLPLAYYLALTREERETLLRIVYLRERQEGETVGSQ